MTIRSPKARISDGEAAVMFATLLYGGQRVPPVHRRQLRARQRSWARPWRRFDLGVGVGRGVAVGVAVDVAVAVGVGVGVPPAGAWIATVIGEPVLKNPTVALTACGG